MDIKYKIVEAYPQDHVIVVRYYTDTITELDLASSPEKDSNGKPIRCRTDVSISVPIPEPSEDELNKLIMLNCPITFFETQEKIKDPGIDTSMSLVKSKLNKEIVITSAEFEKLKAPILNSSTTQVLTDEEIEKLIQSL